MRRSIRRSRSACSPTWESTSGACDDRPTIILKLFRTLHHGENPDVTVQRVLSDAGSPYVPRFFGSLDAQWPDVGRPAGSAHGTLAFAQEFLPGVRDGWSSAMSEVPAVAARADAISTVYEDALARPWPLLQRIHGDLHLGQVLAVAQDGWRIIDFEGEPLRPMSERAIPDLAFLDAYTRAEGAVELDDVVLRALVLDKAIYEAIYEARNRPDWLPVPLAGIDAALF